MPLQARRIFRLSFTVALSLAIAYGLAMPIPFIAPIFALVIALKPAQPMGLKTLVGVLLLLVLTQAIGLLLVPLLLHYPVTAIMLIAIGIYFSMYLAINRGQGLIGNLLTIGFTIIPAAGLPDFSIALTLVHAFTMGMALAVISLWIVYPFFPEDPLAAKPAKPAPTGSEQSNWIAFRVTLIVLPTFLVSLLNPAAYLKVIMKAVALGQQGTFIDAHHAGRELLGSTFLGGGFAILFWFLLDLMTSLWMFFWLTVLFCVYFSSKIFRLLKTRYPASFWVNVVITMLILLGSAVQDSADGKDVYQAFVGRMGMFVLVTLYAWLAIYLLESYRERFQKRKQLSLLKMEAMSK